MSRELTFPLSTQNVAEVMAERDAEIARLRKENSYLVHTDEDIKAQNAEIERLQEHVATLQELRELDRVLIAQLRAALEPKP